MKSISEILNSNIPDYLQNRDNLVEYLNSVGIFLDETRQRIMDFDFFKDYAYGVPYTIKQSLESFGFEIPPLLAEDLRRLILRDAIESFIKTGTEDSLLWVMRVIGLEPDIRYAWLPSAREVRKGYIIDPLTRERIPYHPDQFTYTQFLYGDTVVGADGTFFEGYTYTDHEQESKFGPYPILGEQYEKIPDDSEMAVARTPYVVVRAQSNGYNTVTDPYIGDDGIEYEYSEQEAFRVVNDLLEYFLFRAARPATVRVIIIVALQMLDDTFEVDGEYTEEVILPPPQELEQEPVTVDHIESQIDGTSEVDGLVVGQIGAYIGTQPPFQSQLSILDGELMTDNQNSYSIDELEFPNWDEQVLPVFVALSSGESDPVHLKAMTEVVVVPIVSADLEIRGYVDSETTSYDVLGTTTKIQSEVFAFKNDHTYRYITISSDPIDTYVCIRVRHNTDFPHA